MYTTILAIDIVGYGRLCGNADMHTILRETAYRQLAAAFAMTQIPLDACTVEDRGDGALVVLPAAVDCDHCLDPLAHHLAATLRRHNQNVGGAARLRLRMAVHFGYIQRDRHGVCGHAATHLFRLIEAPAFKTAMQSADSDLGMLVSDQLYNDALERGLINPGAYRPVRVAVKETRAKGWLWLSRP